MFRAETRVKHTYAKEGSFARSYLLSRQREVG